ncbi:MAG: hypothetical protein IJS94_03370, partial [Clostridia bacterium]|nr:hypothetical protein [Clostridia bacterium]
MNKHSPINNIYAKKAFSALLTLILLFTAFPGTFRFSADALETSGKCGERLTWSLQSGVLTISGAGEMYDFT